MKAAAAADNRQGSNLLIVECWYVSQSPQAWRQIDGGPGK